ncbi:hypothetical protein Achl_4407 (plasmid) [Pseudarthrobacter chlorophenolicus A6]|uniref:Uncharacterized protein n=1 Tax=Pseudarthrobacter chlorophenolicus (strain ATCC 700700 / DSM 12829 / CIP 107037 / JCM 12360 / KCTC 9906 / NCIMB 13794 / A6) TaxID=452863 RepID=B8HIW1_PSECP|nr:hypothetical protein [Pseudarthrobacter chlorophenolicus]ACL42358.1 hypothetical protein Achl_4407 [Pseudarthrobacter chlorophenolicus A6]SDQ17021.1 hypothetical protein SAMN04489738_0464 [Pseudarthrobacter chlorophenolicus]
MRNPVGTPTAARLLGLRQNDAARNSRPLPSAGATHFWNPSRGGGSVIVGADGTFLFRGSSATWDRHLEDYVAGCRTEPGDNV